MKLPGDASTSIDGHHLAGDKRRIRRKEKRRSCDIVGRAATLEQSTTYNFLLQLCIGDAVGGPHDWAGRDRVDANLRAQLPSESASEHDESRFSDSVYRIASQWSHPVNIDDVEYESLRQAKYWRGGLREKQRGLEVGSEQIVPMCFRNFADWCRIERRGVVDEDVEPAESIFREARERIELSGVEQVRADARCTVRTCGVKVGDERLRLFRRSLVMHHDACTGVVKNFYHRCADTTRPAGHQRDFSGERLIRAYGARRVKVAHRVRL